ncbi:MAG: hypothetical protein EA422_03615 [Gemmatimonadales bacterium]|nr:MAG: hypothetical protein EA422_03615 [Gemmatimonadales bacterium]
MSPFSGHGSVKRLQFPKGPFNGGVGGSVAKGWAGGVKLLATAGVALCLVVPGAWAQDGAGLERPQPLPVEGKLFNLTTHPADPRLASVERTNDAGTRGDLLILDVQRGIVRTIDLDGPTGGAGGGAADPLAFLYGDPEEARPSAFSGELSWRPVADSEGRRWFSFISSGSGSGYGLGLGWARVTETGSLEVDAFSVDVGGAAAGEPVRTPVWSHDGRSLAFTTGRSLHVIPDVRPAMVAVQGAQLQSHELVRNDEGIGFPAWSPDGRAIAFQERMPSDAPGLPSQALNLRTQRISVINLAVDRSESSGAVVGLTDGTIPVGAGQQQGWDFHQYRPSWSPDGTMVAFLTDRVPAASLSAEDSRKGIQLVRIDRDGNGRVRTGIFVPGRASAYVAGDVLEPQRGYRGPQWLERRLGTDGDVEISIVFIARDPDLRNPIGQARITRREGAAQVEVQSSLISEQAGFGTVMHSSLSALGVGDGLRLTFVSQSGNTERISRWDAFSNSAGGNLEVRVPHEISRRSVMLRSTFMPGYGQYHRGDRGRAMGFLAASAVVGVVGPIHVLSSEKILDDGGHPISSRRDVALDRFWNWAAIGAGVWAISLIEAALASSGTMDRTVLLAGLGSDTPGSAGPTLQPVLVAQPGVGGSESSGLGLGLSLRIPVGNISP